MTQDEIIRMAREAISDTINQHDQMLKRLWCIAYEEGQKAEREACAKVCEELSERYLERCKNFFDERYAAAEVAATECAAAIRARSDNDN